MLLVSGIVVAIAMGLGVLFCVLMWAATVHLSVGLALVTMVCLLDASTLLQGALRLGITVYPADLLFVLLAASAIIRYLTVRRIRDLPKIWLVFIALLLANAIYGLVKFKTAAGVEFRPYFYFLVAVSYFASFADTARGRSAVVNNWLLLSLGIAVLAIYRWSMMGLGLEEYAYLDTTGGVSGRVINSSEALILTGALVMLAYGLLGGIVSKAWLWLLPLVFIVIVGSQQRTVWVCTLFAIGLIFLLERGRSGRFAAVLFVLVSLLAVAGLLGGGHLEQATQTVAGAAAGGLNTTGGTFVGGRVESWKELLRDYSHSGPISMLVGKPFGSGFARVVQGQELTYAPHNHYIEILLRAGAIGLCLYVAIYGLVMTTLIRERESKQLGYTRMLWVLLAVQLIFSITYTPNYVQAILLGMALGTLMSRNQAGGQVSTNPPFRSANAAHRRAHGVS